MVTHRTVSFVICAILFTLDVAHAQSSWKPNIGDTFICEVTESCNCGDYGCSGTDTIQFVIVDTSRYFDGKHNAVIAATTVPIALHVQKWVWGGESTLIGNTYRDTTHLSIREDQVIETDLRGGVAPSATSLWLNAKFDKDTSVTFSGTAVSGVVPSTGFARPVYLPTIGWFYSIGGSQWDNDICCPDMAGLDHWSLQLIAAIQPHRAVYSPSQPAPQIWINNNQLTLVGSVKNIDLYNSVGYPLRLWPIGDGHQNTIQISLADIPNGLYFLRTTNGNSVAIQKIAILR